MSMLVLKHTRYFMCTWHKIARYEYMNMHETNSTIRTAVYTIKREIYHKFSKFEIASTGRHGSTSTYVFRTIDLTTTCSRMDGSSSGGL